MLPLDWRLREDHRWHDSAAAQDMSIMFWHLLPGPVVRGQAYMIPRFDHGGKGGKKILLDGKTRRVWPNAASSERAKCIRENVLWQFWHIQTKA